MNSRLSRKKSTKKSYKPRVSRPHLKPFTFQQRILDLDRITSENVEDKTSGSELCLRGDHLGKVAELTGRIGTPSLYGEAFSAVHYVEGKAIRISVKKVPLLSTDLKEVFSKKALLRGNSVWGEILSYILCTVLVLAETTQGLPIYYRYYTCDKCSFVNKRVAGPPTQPCMYIINELADYDLKQFLEKDIRLVTNEIVLNAIFQIAQALYTIENQLGMTHNDLHYGNVLVHKVKPGGFWEYVIDGKKFFLPNLGFVFVLWDFGMSHIPSKIRGRPHFNIISKNPTPGETDIGRITSILGDVLQEKNFKFTPSCRSMINFVVKNEGKITLKNILHSSHFSEYLKNPDESEIIQTFHTNRKNVDKAIQKELRRFFK